MGIDRVNNGLRTPFWVAASLPPCGWKLHCGGNFLKRTPAHVASHADGKNRRIIDRAFAAAKVQPTARLETNSIMNLISSVRSMGLCSIMPDYFRNALGSLEGVSAIPLIEPTVSHKVGLVAVDREPLSPLIAALFASAKVSPISE